MTYKIVSWGKIWEVRVFATSYCTNGNLAVCAEELDGSPFATITVNLDVRLNYGHAYVDVNNCPWAVDFLRRYGLAEFTGKTCRSGFVEYPLYKFNMEVLESDG